MTYYLHILYLALCMWCLYCCLYFIVYLSLQLALKRVLKYIFEQINKLHLGSVEKECTCVKESGDTEVIYFLPLKNDLRELDLSY